MAHNKFTFQCKYNRVFNCSNEDNFMKRFKQFVMSLKDDVDEFEAVDSYKKYKTKYKKNSITKFYKAHQNEEWYVVIVFFL